MNPTTTSTNTQALSVAQGLVIGVLYLIYFVVIVFAIVGMWKTFKKAGQPGWAAIIPIYNLYIMCKITGRPGWWVLLFLIPFVNIVVLIMVALAIAKAFGKSEVFGIFGLWLFAPIGYMILGFGSATFQGQTAPIATQSVPPAPPATPTPPPAAPTTPTTPPPVPPQAAV